MFWVLLANRLIPWSTFMRVGTNCGCGILSPQPAIVIAVACLALGILTAPTRAAVTFDAAPTTIRASSAFDGNNGPAKLFDGTISAADLGTTNNLGGQYASSGTGNGVFADNDFNPVVSMDFASAISANSIVY